MLIEGRCTRCPLLFVLELFVKWQATRGNRVGKRALFVTRRHNVDLLSPTISMTQDDALALGVDAEGFPAGDPGEVEGFLRDAAPRELE